MGGLVNIVSYSQSLMIIASGPNFTSTYHGVNTRLAQCLNSVLNVKVLVGTFNQEKALVGAVSMIVKLQTSRMLVSSSSGVGRRLRTGAGIGEPESNLVDKKIRAVVDWWPAPQ